MKKLIFLLAFLVATSAIALEVTPGGFLKTKTTNVVNLEGSSQINPAGVGIAVQSGTSAAEVAVSGNIAAPSAGLGTTDARLVFHATMDADAQDIAGSIYIPFFADTFSNAGGAGEAAAFYIGLGYSISLFSTSGDMSFEDYAPIISTINSELINQSGYPLTIQAADGYDSGATPRSGGSIVLDPGAGVNGGKDGVIRLNGLVSTSGTAPAISSCGTSPAVATGSDDYAGKITIGSGVTTSCTLAFVVDHSNPPSCIVTPESNVTAYASVLTSNTFTVTFSGDMDSAKWDYHCVGLGEI